MIQKHRLLLKSGQPEVTPNMIRRNLWPEFDQDILKSTSTKSERRPLSEYLKPITFNDYSFYHLKEKPHFIHMGYTPHEFPKIPVYFPPHLNNIPRQQGYEEEGWISKKRSEYWKNEIRSI